MATLVTTASSAGRQASEHTFATWDGVQLFYRAWLPAERAAKAVIFFHRGHEHSGRFQEMADALALDEFAIFAWDARGHGRSPGERGYAEDFSYFVRDADTFVRFIAAEYGIALSDIVVVAHSVGAVIAATWVHDYAPPIRALVLGGPAFRVKLYIPFALFFLRLQMMFRKKAYVKSYVKARMLTHDPAEQASYESDPLISRQIAVNILIGMHDASTRVVNDASAISVPTLVLASGKDWVVKVPPQCQFYERLSSKRKDFHVFPGFFHDLFHEQERALPIAKTRAFIMQSFEKPIQPVSLLAGTLNRPKYEELSKPGRGLLWSAQRLFLKTVGRLSEGIRIGWRSGFDSGVSLDYVYRNCPNGIVDRIYLDSPGWRGIRIRKTNLQALLRTAIENAQGPARLLDVATGGGRYVLEVLQQMPEVHAELRDWDAANLDAARALAAELNVKNVSFAKGDAFDRDAVSAINPRPNIAIVSGLYELFPDNQMVLRSLEGMAAALDPGGHLIYTNQPWHPQLEMIARVLDNREGKPWIMRCRAQAEMDELARAAGFEKLEMLADPDGIFTVSLARKIA